MKNVILFVLMLVVSSQAQIITPSFTGGGTTSYSAWSNVNALNYSGYGGFPGNSPWPSPIAANQGSSIPTLNRISGSPTGGGPFLSSESIYFGNFAQVPNALGGTLRISNSSPLFNLKTIVFQIQIGEATGFDFYQPTGFPKISINGSTYSFSSFTNLVNRFQNGTFPSPETGKDEPVYVNTWAYQWNLTNSSVNSYAIDFSGVTHSQIYALRLDGTSVLQSTPVIPEPSTYALIILAILGIFFWKVLKKSRQSV